MSRLSGRGKQARKRKPCWKFNQEKAALTGLTMGFRFGRGPWLECPGFIGGKEILLWLFYGRRETAENELCSLHVSSGVETIDSQACAGRQAHPGIVTS